MCRERGKERERERERERRGAIAQENPSSPRRKGLVSICCGRASQPASSGPLAPPPPPPPSSRPVSATVETFLRTVPSSMSAAFRLLLASVMVQKIAASFHSSRLSLSLSLSSRANSDSFLFVFFMLLAPPLSSGTGTGSYRRNT